MPIYSGGLGVLAGAHLKSASDMGLPLMGIGLRYQQGYFHQGLDSTGWQVEYYENTDFSMLPAGLVLVINDGHTDRNSLTLTLGSGQRDQPVRPSRPPIPVSLAIPVRT